MDSTITFRNTIRKTLQESFVVINELFFMRNFNILQIHVLKEVALLLGKTTPEEINGFLKGPEAVKLMKTFRQALISRFGESEPGMPDTEDPGFNINNSEAHTRLVKLIANDIIAQLRSSTP